jgi:hypothetical protein
MRGVTVSSPIENVIEEVSDHGNEHSGLLRVFLFAIASSRALQNANAQKNSRHQEDAGCGLWGSDPGVQGCGWVGICGQFKVAGRLFISFQRFLADPRHVRDGVFQSLCRAAAKIAQSRIADCSSGGFPAVSSDETRKSPARIHFRQPPDVVGMQKQK